MTFGGKNRFIQGEIESEDESEEADRENRLATKSNLFHSKSYFRSGTTEGLLDAQRFLSVLLYTVIHIYDHMVQMNTSSDHLFPQMDSEVESALTLTNDQPYSSEIGK